METFLMSCSIRGGCLGGKILSKTQSMLMQSSRLGQSFLWRGRAVAYAFESANQIYQIVGYCGQSNTGATPTLYVCRAQQEHPPRTYSEKISLCSWLPLSA